MRKPLLLLAGLVTPALLSACSGPLGGGGAPPGLANDCLAVSLADAGSPDFDGPVSDLLSAFQGPDVHQSWENAPGGGHILRLARADALTHKTVNSAVEFLPAGDRQTKACGPKRMAVSRILAGGTEITGAQLMNTVLRLVAPAVQAREEQRAKTAASGAAQSVGPAPASLPASPPAQTTNTAAPTAPSPPASKLSPGPTDADLSPAYGSCMNSGDAANGVTVALLNCAAAETARQDARLNFAYKAKMAGLPPDQQQALRVSERDWIKSRDATCKSASDEEAGGSLAGVIYAQCVMKQEAARADQLGAK